MLIVVWEVTGSGASENELCRLICSILVIWTKAVADRQAYCSFHWRLGSSLTDQHPELLSLALTF